jgi:hypothetical protein
MYYSSLTDRQIIMLAVAQNGYALQYAPLKFKGDKEVVLKAVRQYGRSLEFASKELKADKDVVLQAVQQYGNSLCYASRELKKDKEVVLSAVKQRSSAFLFADQELKADLEIVLETLNGDTKPERAHVEHLCWFDYKLCLSLGYLPSFYKSIGQLINEETMRHSTMIQSLSILSRYVKNAQQLSEIEAFVSGLSAPLSLIGKRDRNVYENE